MEHEFNLIQEPWLLVRTPECEIKTVSLRDVFLHAHEYSSLAGELPTQDAAVLRLLLAILHTVFSRVDEVGNPACILEEDDALDRWEALWKNGCFPRKPILDYLEEWKDRFWLFDDKFPFWQVPEAKVGTQFSASKLNGIVSQSNHKARIFSSWSGEAKERLSYPEAARWLLYINGYDDAASPKKKTGKGNELPGMGLGWLGQIGFIYAKGSNLFETLMLNLVFLQDGEQLWKGTNLPCTESYPSWEREVPRTGERTKILVPTHPCSFLTIQSRRLLLIRENNKVSKYHDMGGDFFDKENAFAEQMTIWTVYEDRKGLKTWYPKKLSANRQIWRDYSSIAVKQSSRRRPGIVEWIKKLRDEEILDRNHLVHFATVGVAYDSNNASITDVWGDELVFHIDLLTALGHIWNDFIEEEIKKCDTAAFYIASLSESLKKAEGNSGDISSDDVKAAFYAAIDAPFREWLYTLSPSQSPRERDQLITQWRDTAEQIAKDMAQELIDVAGPAAFMGRTLNEREKGKEVARHYSAPEAMNLFLYRIKKLYHSEVK